ncbi:MAG TPA: hypothetical protein VII75_03195 [Thermoanaerobaculia bacterium]
MRRAFIALLITIAAGTARAQTTTTDAPDFSREHLRQVFAANPIESDEDNVHVGFGTIQFPALGINWHLGYLPVLAPLHGSVPGTMKVLPDAFSLNHVIFPGWRPVIDRDAGMQRELVRIGSFTMKTGAH